MTRRDTVLCKFVYTTDCLNDEDGCVIELCAARKAWLFCDEVYRELEHDPAALLPAAVDLYEHAISLGSMSKTYGLPGLRLGWLASHDRAALTKIIDFKHYTTICSSAPSEFLSAVALRHRSVFADRSRAIVLANLALIDALMRSIVPVPERSSIVLNPRDPNAFLSSKHSITRSPVALRGKEKCEICVLGAGNSTTSFLGVGISCFGGLELGMVVD